MQFGIEKCPMLLMNKRRSETVGVKLTNPESIGTFGEKESYDYLRISEADSIQ